MTRKALIWLCMGSLLAACSSAGDGGESTGGEGAADIVALCDSPFVPEAAIGDAAREGGTKGADQAGVGG